MSDINTKILEALKRLDPTSDAQWDQNGVPLLEAVRALAGEPKLSRALLTNAAPELNRATFETWLASQTPSLENQTAAATEPDLATKIEEHEGSLLDLDAQIAALVAQKEQTQKDCDALRDEHVKLNPPPQPGEVIQDHLRLQHEERMARHLKLSGQLEAVLGPNGKFVASSPLDAARAAMPKVNPSHVASTGDN